MEDLPFLERSAFFEIERDGDGGLGRLPDGDLSEGRSLLMEIEDAVAQVARGSELFDDEICRAGLDVGDEAAIGRDVAC